MVRLHINNWLEVSFCLPHKIHYVATNFIPPEAIERSLKSIRYEQALPLRVWPVLAPVPRVMLRMSEMAQSHRDGVTGLQSWGALRSHRTPWGCCCGTVMLLDSWGWEATASVLTLDGCTEGMLQEWPALFAARNCVFILIC